MKLNEEQRTAIVRAAVEHEVVDPNDPDSPERIMEWALGAREAGVYTPAIHAVLDAVEDNA